MSDGKIRSRDIKRRCVKGTLTFIQRQRKELLSFEELEGRSDIASHYDFTMDDSVMAGEY